MIIVHHLNNSRSQRVLWLLEELGIEYEIKRYQRDQKTMLAPPELRQVHPLGKSPVVTDGDLTLAESGAIIEYIVERYGNGRLVPAAGTPEKLRYNYWLHYAEGSIQPMLLMKLIFDRIEKAPMPFFARPIAKAISRNTKSSFIDPNIKRHLDYMEAELGKDAVVCRQRVHGRRRPDELSPGGGRGSRWVGLAMAESDRIPQSHPRASRLQACDRKRRGVSVTALIPLP